jgi:uncharacterized protein (DUF433 family)
MNADHRIEVNPKVMLGKPVVKGTRIPVELILRKLGEGVKEAELLDAYPRLTREDIQAALLYAADTLAHEETLVAPPLPVPAPRMRTSFFNWLAKVSFHFTRSTMRLFAPAPDRRRARDLCGRRYVA